MRWKILILIVVLMVPTCMYTLKNTERNTYYLGPRVDVPPERPTVFLNAGDLTFEAQVLEASGLFEFSEDPATPIHVTLHEVRSEVLCGMPLLVMIFGGGLVPLKMPLRGELDISLTEGGVTTKRTLSYDCETRSSFWESFRQTDKFEELGQSVRARAQ